MELAHLSYAEVGHFRGFLGGWGFCFWVESLFNHLVVQRIAEIPRLVIVSAVVVSLPFGVIDLHVGLKME